jgi:tetratricopeptide (TPR) repeat protein
MGRLDDAVVECHTALELDPASVSIRRSMGWVYYYARRYDQARYHLSRAIAMNPTAVENYRVVALALAQQGQWAEAERVIREALTLPATGPYTLATLGYVLARAGRRGEAEDVLADLEARGRTGYVSPVAFATVHLGLEQWQRALDWAERAYEERRGWLAYFKVNALVDPLRKEPRFEALLKKMRL